MILSSAVVRQSGIVSWTRFVSGWRGYGGTVGRNGAVAVEPDFLRISGWTVLPHRYVGIFFFFMRHFVRLSQPIIIVNLRFVPLFHFELVSHIYVYTGCE